ncbi:MULTISPECIES: acyl-CoA dehydrogenase family protein [unclassified Pseudofrankia]|uniref:acyl-CoA dehydrogenase family protein n=1 Tax=unclassified Pseudofrankia TaxID=2994372 RepID=UPI0008DAA3C7|nr:MULTISPECIES: acyl-CoA dehydrogenase family protein [unclassified Pseudofrankia]MDT3441910.1 acyl-CoA dehydrogenase family protein [Pseudofrankia sp. BMG5.37]OHV44556.1 acyl-CoA dehydrogenase [Pseudofrankia sp. BMG5.36]
MTNDSDDEIRIVDDAVGRLLAEHPPEAATRTGFLGAQFDAGLAWVSFPVQLGGLGVSPGLQPRVNARLSAAGAPIGFDSNPLGYGMGGPTLLQHGSPEQHARYLRPLFSGEEVWCQLFSEPGAGSDLAGLATRAERDGDGWVVNGQKVWTSWGHVARWGMLVARTDPRAVKHRGLTYFLCDMTAHGVDVRPLRQLTGDAEFNEVYLTDVHLPDRLRVGPVGGGWAVALTTLNNERYMLSEGLSAEPALRSALAAWRDRADRTSPTASALRDALLALRVDVEVNRLTTLRATEGMTRGATGPEGAVAKLMTARLNKRATDLTVDLLGAAGMLHESYQPREVDLAQSGDQGSPTRAFLRARANTIEGGTSEILHNILGEQMLGLPGEIRVDKGIPWTDVRRS